MRLIELLQNKYFSFIKLSIVIFLVFGFANNLAFAKSDTLNQNQFPIETKYSDELSVDQLDSAKHSKVIDSLDKLRNPVKVIIPLADFTYSNNREHAKANISYKNYAWYQRVFYYIKTGFQNDDLIIRNAYYLIFLFLGIFILINAYLFFNRMNNSYWTNRKNKLEKKFDLLLTGVIYIDDSELGNETWKEEKEKVIKHFKNNYLKNSFNKAVLEDMIISLHRNFSGTTASVLRNLYIELAFDQSSIKKLKNTEDWSALSKIIRDLAQMEIVSAVPIIKEKLNHINPILRLEAGIALLKLDLENPFALLDQGRELTEWQQLNLLEAIRSSTRIKIPMFNKWFNSKEDSIVVFCLLLIDHFKQLDVIEDVIGLLNHSSDKVKIAAVKCLGQLEVYDSDINLVIMFDDSSFELQLEILNACGRIASADGIEFLKWKVFDKNFEISFRAANGLKRAGIEGEKVLNYLLTRQNTDPQLLCIINHALDQRLLIV